MEGQESSQEEHLCVRLGPQAQAKRRKRRKNEVKMGQTYLVISNKRPGSYRLADSEGNELSHSWNADSLKKYYI